MSKMLLRPLSSTYWPRPVIMSCIVIGRVKFAVPTPIAVAPARMNSIASRVEEMPPMPMTGSETARHACHTMRTAMGRMAGPDTPPVIVPVAVRLASTSMTMPLKVFIAEMAVAPPASDARAISPIDVTLGVSFAITGPWNRSDTPRITRSTMWGSEPISRPPASRFGQEMLTSRPATPSSPFRRAARASYSPGQARQYSR